MPKKVTDPNKVVTDPVLLRHLSKQGIDKGYVEFYQDYASAYVNGKKVKGQSPYAKFYRDLKSKKQFMVVSGLPMVDADGVKIETGWRVAGINYFTEKNNLFRAKVQGTDIEVIVRNDQPDGRKANDKLSYKPQLFLDGIEQTCGQPILLPVDPVNPNYLENTLEWDYGICKRRLRIIEGSVLGSWVFASKPIGEVRIKYNQTGDYRLRLGQFKVSDDEELIPQDVFENPISYGFFLGYPLVVSDSQTFYPDADPETSSVDGDVRHGGANLVFHNIVIGAGTVAYPSTPDLLVQIYCGTTADRWTQIGRSILLFNTSGLPDGSKISAAVLSVYGEAKENPIPISPTLNVYSSAPASNTDLVAGDYDSLGTTPFSTAIAYADFKVADPFWNDFALNAAGIDTIPTAPANACAKFGLREATYDVTDTQPAWSSAANTYMVPWSSDKGVGYKPKLVVTYTPPSGEVWLELIHTSALISANPLWDVRNIIVENDIMYFCEEANYKLSSWNVTDPTNPIKLDDITFTGSPLDIRKKGNYVFITCGHAGWGGNINEIVSVNVTDPANLTLADTLLDATWLVGPHGSYLDGDFLYVACFTGDTFTIVDVSNPNDLVLRGHSNAASLNRVHDVVVAYPYAYVASHWGTGGGTYTGEVTCFNVSDPDNPTVESVSVEKAQFIHIVKKGNYLFVGGYTGLFHYLYSFDISTPTVMTYVSRVQSMDYWIALSGNYAIAGGADGSSPGNLYVVNISNPAYMAVVSIWTEAGLNMTRNIFIENTYVYVCCQETATGGKFKVFKFNTLATLGGKTGNIVAKMLASGVL